MAPGMKITATTLEGTITITAVDELTRSYTWEGATRSVEMWPREERWNGSKRLYFPGAGNHWKEHNGITRGVVEEGQQHFKTTEDALKWLREHQYPSLIYRHDGLAVGWDKTLPRKQLNVEVWQVYVNGKKPRQLLGSQDKKIVVTYAGKQNAASSLGKAVEQNNVQAVKALLQKGSDPNVKDSAGTPVLATAAWRGYTEVVQALLDKKANPNAHPPKVLRL
jgi:hypothetical protein